MAWPPEVAAAESPLYEILRLMSRRPGMYLGERPLEALQFYLIGYRDALSLDGRSDPVLDAMEAGDMNAHFAAELGLAGRYSGENAFKMVRYVSPSETGAVEAFFLHLDGFLQSKAVAVRSPSISEELHARRFGSEAGKSPQD